jgi:hypothetical protein
VQKVKKMVDLKVQRLAAGSVEATGEKKAVSTVGYSEIGLVDQKAV